MNCQICYYFFLLVYFTFHLRCSCSYFYGVLLVIYCSLSSRAGRARGEFIYFPLKIVYGAIIFGVINGLLCCDFSGRMFILSVHVVSCIAVARSCRVTEVPYYYYYFSILCLCDFRIYCKCFPCEDCSCISLVFCKLVFRLDLYSIINIFV